MSATVPYTKGAHMVAEGVWAYLQPDGGWGRSNAGLVTGGGVSLLIDTLFDLESTAKMLTAPAPGDPRGGADHDGGQHPRQRRSLLRQRPGGRRRDRGVGGVRQEMTDVPPSLLAAFLKAAPELGELGRFLVRIFGGFSFDGIELVPPTRTFEGELEASGRGQCGASGRGRSRPHPGRRSGPPPRPGRGVHRRRRLPRRSPGRVVGPGGQLDRGLRPDLRPSTGCTPWSPATARSPTWGRWPPSRATSSI